MHRVFFDNYFSRYELFREWSNFGIQANGTFRENIVKESSLKSQKFLQKEGRGSCNYQFDDNTNIFYVQLIDIKCVTVGTNFDSIEPISNVNCCLNTSKSKGRVLQPQIIVNYNRYMNGIDHHNWFVGKYGTSVWGKK